MKKTISYLLCILMLTGCILTSCSEKPSDTTDVQTQTVKEDPEEISFDIKNLILETDKNFKRSFDFTMHTLATCKKNKYLNLSGSLDRNDSDGLVGMETSVSAIGFSEELTSFPYTAKAHISSDGADRREEERTVMLGILCKKVTQRHIEGGLWFMFRGDKITAFVADSLNCTVADNLPFDCDDGVTASVTPSDDGIIFTVNDSVITTVKKTDGGFTLVSPDGEQQGSYSGDKVQFTDESHGFFRIGINQSTCKIKNMELSHVSQQTFSPDTTVYAFMKDKNYSFHEKESFMHSCRATDIGGKLYADVEAVLDMFEFDYEINDSTVTARRTNATLTMEKGVAEMDVSGTKYPFTSLKDVDGNTVVCIESFAKILGYVTSYDAQSGLCTVYGENTDGIEDKAAMMKENYRLYEDVIFNYDDVECDDIGFGRYEQAPYEERLVGIAYSTWNSNTSWWKSTWGTPLYGEYDADDEELLKYHAELLAEADVDFVVIDWSNNTHVTKSTYDGDETFRIIEAAAYRMFEVWSKIPNAPKIAIMTGPGHAGVGSVNSGAHQRKVDQVYSSFVDNDEYGDMYFYYLGKPLLMCYGATPHQYGVEPSWNDDRFTLRWVTGYVGQQGHLHDRKLQSKGFWSWEERSPQTYSVYDGVVEAVTCSAATRGETTSSSELKNNGATFKKQFQRANGLGAKIVILTTWNEWTKGEQKSPEQSKDLEPSVEQGTFYYDLMREQIKKFKGKIG